MTRFVPAHQHAFMSLIAGAMFVAFVGYMVWTALRPSDASDVPEAAQDAGP